MENHSNNLLTKEKKTLNKVLEIARKTGRLVAEIIIFPAEIAGAIVLMTFSKKYGDKEIDEWLTNKFFKNRKKD